MAEQMVTDRSNSTMEVSTHLSDYLAVLRRRKVQLLVPAVVIFLASVALAFAIPPLYRSTATIITEQLEIPQDLVGTTITEFANERFQIISQRILSHNNLWQIIEKLDLYPHRRKTDDREEVVAHMRRNIKVKTETTTKDARSGESTQASIAFNLSFYAHDPGVAQRTAKELVALYLSENLKTREKKVDITSSLLAQEERKVGEHVSDLEAKLAVYKEKHSGRLPELMGVNLAQVDRIERELEETERQIFAFEERKIYLQSQLAQLQPNIGTDPSVRLREVQTRYLSASALYAPNHPDLVKMRREIELLKKEVGGVDQATEISQQLITTRAQLAQARKKYSDKHPDVVRLRNAVASLEEALRNTAQAPQSVVSTKPDNPAYIAVKTELDAVRLSLKTAQQKRGRVKAKRADYERRLAEMPRVEQTGRALTREHADAVRKHDEIRQRLMEAELKAQLEWEQEGERYSLLQSPGRPRKPSRNRPAILFLGLLLSLGVGIGYASWAEYMDRTVRGTKSVRAALGAPPLGVIPYIQTE